ncbi:MAG: hypothetical protein LPK85_01065 [Gammaproteobacteria bacterium]|nr:hypothetical protein [Gammaproteobacteria bacterium]
MQVDSDLRVPVGDNGKRLFVNIPSAGLAFETRASIANTATPPATISPGMVIDKDVYASYYPRDMQVTIGEVPVDPLAPLGPQKLVYSIKDPASGRVLVDQADYQDNARIVVEGISFEIRGTPAPGDTFRVDASSEGTQSVTSTIERLIYGLENVAAIPEGRRAFDDLLGTTLTNLDNAQNRISEVRSEVGARMNTLDTTRDFLAESKQLVQEKLADLRDLDYTEAISRLTMENFILQAAQQSYVQVSRLSLFDRL